MRYRFLLAIVVAVLGFAGPGVVGPASARYMTGAALLDWCKDDGSTFCPGYLAAMADYQSVLQSLNTDTELFCLPNNVKLGALRPIALDGLGARPQDELLKGVAAAMLLPALAERYPPLPGDRGCAEKAAAYLDGTALLEWCQDEASRLCQGYIAAIVDYQDELVRRDTATPRFCLREDTRMSELFALTLKVLRANPPREMRKIAASLVIPGFFRTYPCRQ
jgi:hypothetical protein